MLLSAFPLLLTHAFVAKKEGLTHANDPLPVRIVAIPNAVMLAVAAILLFSGLGAGSDPYRLAFVTGAACLAGTLYFLMIAAGGEGPIPVKSLAGMGYILMHVAYVMMLYFDTTVATGNPVKVFLMAGFLCSLLHLVTDIRITLAKPLHIFSRAISWACAVMTGLAGIGGILLLCMHKKLPFGLLPHLILTLSFLFIYVRALWMPRAGVLAQPDDAPARATVQTAPAVFDAETATVQPNTPTIRMGEEEGPLNLTDPTPRHRIQANQDHESED